MEWDKRMSAGAKSIFGAHGRVAAINTVWSTICQCARCGGMSNAIAAITRSKPSHVSINISAWHVLRLTYRESLRGNIPTFIHLNICDDTSGQS